jgi:hypothetical protein
MSPTTRDAKKQAKARQRHRLQARERLERDRRQAQHAAKVLEQALHDLGLPENLVAEIEGRLRSQQQLLGKIVGLMCPPLFGCRTNFELCRVRGWRGNKFKEREVRIAIRRHVQDATLTDQIFELVKHQSEY